MSCKVCSLTKGEDTGQTEGGDTGEVEAENLFEEADRWRCAGWSGP